MSQPEQDFYRNRLGLDGSIDDNRYKYFSRYAVAQDPATGALGGVGSISVAGHVRTLTLEAALTDSILARLPDGRYIGTSNDAAGGFGGRLWYATGAPGSLTKTGIAATNVAALKNTLGAVFSVGVIQCVWPLSDGNFLFTGSDSSSRCSLFYARAGGGTFTVGANNGTWNDLIAVADLGRIGASHTGHVRQLHERSLCTARIGGAEVLFFGEYNVSTGRVPGAAFDQCRVLRSDDLGKTWTTFLSWNTNGSSSQMRHVHAVRQDAETGYVYIMIGDDPWSSLIRWDGVGAAPPINTPMASFANYPGWEVLPNSEWYRSCDILFGDNSAHYLIDNTSIGDYKRAMSVTRRGGLAASRGRPVDVSAVRDPLIGLLLPDGGGIWLSMWDTSLPGAVRGYDVWSSPDLRTWLKIGHIPDVGSGGTVGVLTNVFWAGDKLLVSLAAGSARLVAGAYGGTLVFNANAFFDGTPKALA